MTKGRKAFIGYIQAISITGLVALGFILAAPEGVASVNVDAKPYYQVLMDTGYCWTDGYQKPIPNQAVVIENGRAELVTSHKKVDQALTQGLGGTKTFDSIIGFCYEKGQK